MTTVAAAVDGSAATKNVVAVATAFAHLVELPVVYVYAGDDDGRLHVVEALAPNGVTALEGDPGPALVEYARRPEVVAMVIGTRAFPGGATPAGHVALYVATNATKPVIVVPPHARVRSTIERVFIPLESNADSAMFHQPIIEMAAEHGLDLVIAHVLNVDEIPPFDNHGGYEAEAWREEFIARYAPLAPGANLRVRVGVPAELVTEIANVPGIDLVALVWSQDLSPERAAVVRRLLASCRHPLLLLPVTVREPALDLRRETVVLDADGDVATALR